MLEENMIRWRKKYMRDTRARIRKGVLKEGLQKGLQEGLEKGLQKGLQKGLKKGRVEGMRCLVLRQLELRFGPLPEGIHQRVEEVSSLKELEALADRLLTAGNLSELGLGDQG